MNSCKRIVALALVIVLTYFTIWLQKRLTMLSGESSPALIIFSLRSFSTHLDPGKPVAQISRRFWLISNWGQTFCTCQLYSNSKVFRCNQWLRCRYYFLGAEESLAKLLVVQDANVRLPGRSRKEAARGLGIKTVSRLGFAAADAAKYVNAEDHVAALAQHPEPDVGGLKVAKLAVSNGCAPVLVESLFRMQLG